MQSIFLTELYTEDRLQYNYYPVTSNCLSFRVKARKDAHIILSSTQYDSIPCYEVSCYCLSERFNKNIDILSPLDLGKCDTRIRKLKFFGNSYT